MMPGLSIPMQLQRASREYQQHSLHILEMDDLVDLVLSRETHSTAEQQDKNYDLMLSWQQS